MTELLKRCVLRVGLPVLVATALFGCAGPAPVVVQEPDPEAEPDPTAFVSGPLPGVDSLVVREVLNDFDSTFVHAAAEIRAQTRFLEGQQLIAHAESILTAVIGPSTLGSIDKGGTVDTNAFAGAIQRARDTLTEAAHALAAQDSTQVQALLASAQTGLEEAVILNPRHEESRYQLARVYRIRANSFQEQAAWEQVLSILRKLVLLRANEHGLWAEIAHALDELGRFSDSAALWLRAAETVLDDARLSFEDAAVDSAQVFNYSERSYRSFVRSRSGEGAYRALMQAGQYATSAEEIDYTRQELVWSQWDYFNLHHRLVFDSLRQVARHTPLQVITELGELIPVLTRPAARWETNYNYAVLSHTNGFEDAALDTLKALWYTIRDITPDPRQVHETGVRDTLVLQPLPYEAFKEDVRSAYGGALFERALLHHNSGQSGHAFTYLMQVVETRSSYTGKAYIEALKLARYNPEQALKMEPKIEEIFEELEREDQLTYLREMGNLYRRLGRNDKTAAFLTRFRAIRDQNPN
ncbi:MAG: hypothetical protein F4246_10600 [Rhodothermaceae bacterium]|nr:hypothetical protein [Rhodothermaceae bacterium]MXX58769.1 hypothetical protein [Rhodothermaceae bacterium]MYD19361.1 hypothetical protein [Rhodothermaceae bacterium]MYD57448.1 hypothetical protein [Rhodothermaceae bacterium]MYI43533.1 hypothetical protein [Rhodothermaceae bacterium]